ncbi:MAG: ATP synthase F1 subunit delta [Candidatus Latescibacteria bacterium]|nr:ATP synthase F1 subunit delta [Candidatus Latescibacterota bacterium]
MVHRGLARRYARALFNAALEKDIIDPINEDVENFKELLETDPYLKGYLISPKILTEEKTALIDKAFGERANPLFIDFLLLLIDKKRFDHALEISEAYISIYEEHCGIVEAKVISAVSLDESQEAKLIEKLQLETNKEVRLTKVTDSKILGGLILFLEDKIVDGSVKFQLESLRRKLKEVKVY